MMKKSTKTLIAAIIAVIFLNVISFRPGHNWGGDFAGYIQQAKCIVQPDFMKKYLEYQHVLRDNRSEGIMIGPFLYPWGYPMLLSIPFSIAGNHIFVFQLTTYLFFSLSTLIIYLLFVSRVSQKTALLLSLAFIVNPVFTANKNNVMSDMPFCMLMLLALYLIDKLIIQDRPLLLKGHSGKPFQFLNFCILGVGLFLPFFFRVQGIVILPILFFIQFWYRKHADITWIFPYAVFCGLFLLSKQVFPESGNYTDHFNFSSYGYIIGNIGYYATLIQEFLFFNGGHVAIAVYFLTLPFFLIGIWTRRKYDIAFIIYLLFNLGLLVCFPLRGGIRFFYHLIPVLLYFIVQGLHHMQTLNPIKKANLPNLFLGYLIFVGILSYSIYFISLRNKIKNGPFLPEAIEMFKAVNEKVPDSDIVYFYKPRVLTLYASKCSSLSFDEKIMSSDQSHIVIDREAEEGNSNHIYQKWVEEHPERFELEFTNTRFDLYRIIPCP